jgi:hypothetical protein
VHIDEGVQVAVPPVVHNDLIVTILRILDEQRTGGIAR